MIPSSYLLFSLGILLAMVHFATVFHAFRKLTIPALLLCYLMTIAVCLAIYIVEYFFGSLYLDFGVGITIGLLFILSFLFFYAGIKFIREW